MPESTRPKCSNRAVTYLIVIMVYLFLSTTIASNSSVLLICNNIVKWPKI